jgi:hypothetical protein
MTITKKEKAAAEKAERLDLINKMRVMTRRPSYTFLKSQDKTFYGIQKLRIQTGNRITTGLMKQLGLPVGVSKEKGLSTLSQELLIEAVKDYKFLADYVVVNKTTLIKAIKDNSILVGSVPEYNLVENYVSLLEEEAKTKKVIAGYLETFPIWSQYLKHIDGVGPLMGAVIISGFDITKCTYVSSMWAYAGYDVVGTIDEESGEMKMEGRSRQVRHLVEREYLDAQGKLCTKRGVSYNPAMRTKMFVLSGSILKAYGKKPNKYGDIYYNAKLKYQNRRQIALLKEMRSSGLTEAKAAKVVDKYWNKTHIHLMAVRIQMKTFLQDLYPVWRGLEGLEVVPPYHERVLERPHHEKIEA